jgi:hypothetical protein
MVFASAATNRNDMSFRSRTVHDINDLPCLKFIGRCGFSGCWDSRRSILHFSYLMTFFSTFCCIFSLISLNKNNTPTQQGCWTYGTSDTSLLYFGISGYFAMVTTGQYTVRSYIDYAEGECDQNSEYCSSCDSAGHTIVFCVFLACATRISSIMLLKARMNPISDIAVIKVLGIFSESLSALCLAGACFVWQEYCKKKLPLTGLVYSDGPGIILCAFALALTCLLVIVHVMLPTIDPNIADPGCCSSKRKEAKGGSKRNHPQAAGAKPKQGGNNPNAYPNANAGRPGATKTEARGTQKMEMAGRQQQQQGNNNSGKQDATRKAGGPKKEAAPNKHVSGYQSSKKTNAGRGKGTANTRR